MHSCSDAKSLTTPAQRHPSLKSTAILLRPHRRIPSLKLDPRNHVTHPTPWLCISLSFVANHPPIAQYLPPYPDSAKSLGLLYPSHNFHSRASACHRSKSLLHPIPQHCLDPCHPFSCTSDDQPWEHSLLFASRTIQDPVKISWCPVQQVLQSL
jgi:hypothetical protein